MKNIKDEFVVWVQLVPFVLIWVIVLYLTGSSLNINAEAIKKLPDVVTVYSIGFVVFTKWGWRWPIFRWLLRFPDLQGTWEGTLQTTWRDPANGQVPGPIPLILVIRQQFSSIACTMYTRESVSFSDAAILTEEDDSGLKQLSYNYTNTPRVTVRDRSVVHSGAAILRIILTPAGSLQGEYWTNRKTTGEMSLRFKSKDLLEELPSRNQA